jgi:hypothetical protein
MFSQTVYKQSLFELATIEFPGKPDIIDTLGTHNYRYVSDSALFIVQILPIDDESSKSLEAQELDKIYDGVISGIVERAKGKILMKKNITVNSFRGVDMELKMNLGIDKPDLTSYRLLYLNSSLLNLSFWRYSNINNQSLEDKKNIFFNSLVLNSKYLETQNTGSSEKRTNFVAYQIGKVLGSLFILSIPILIILYIRHQKRQKQQS